MRSTFTFIYTHRDMHTYVHTCIRTMINYTKEYQDASDIILIKLDLAWFQRKKIIIINYYDPAKSAPLKMKFTIKVVFHFFSSFIYIFPLKDGEWGWSCYLVENGWFAGRNQCGKWSYEPPHLPCPLSLSPPVVVLILALGFGFGFVFGFG